MNFGLLVVGLGLLAFPAALSRWSHRLPPAEWARVATLALILGGLSVGGCATTGYVDEKIAAVNARIDGLEARVQQNADAAAAANSAAQAANSTAQANGQRIDQLTGRVDALEQRMASKSPRN